MLWTGVLHLKKGRPVEVGEDHKKIDERNSKPASKLLFTKSTGRGLQSLEFQHYQQTSKMAVRIKRNVDPLLKMVADHEMRNQVAFLFRADQRALDELYIININIHHELAGTTIT